MNNGRKTDSLLIYLGEMKKLSATELQYMKLIWEHPEGISSAEIFDHFSQSQSTKSSILYNVSEKGYVENIQKGRHHIYFAKITKIEYNQAIIKQKLDKAFGKSSIENLIAMFCGKDLATKEQKEKIKKFLEELKDDDSDK